MEFRTGKISSINEKAGTAKVVCVDLTNTDSTNMVTVEMPFLSFEYDMPNINDQVVYLKFSKKGSCNGVILGKTFNEQNRPVVQDKNKYYKQFAKSINLTVDKQSGEMKINSKAINVTSNVDVIGNINIKGSLKVNGRTVMLE